MAGKWELSAERWNQSKDANLKKIAKNFSDNALVQALQDSARNWYKTHGYGKYYFRDPTTAQEYNSIVKAFNKEQQKGLQNTINSATKTYDTTYGGGFNSNFADQYVNTFLNDKYNDALEQLDRAKARGSINDIGYNKAINDLATQLSAGKSTYGAIGRDIVSGYNTGMQNELENYQNLVNNYNFENDFSKLNTDTINNQLSNTYNNYLSGFENDFDAAMSGQTPFDVSGILGNAKVAQGVINPQTNSLVDAISEQNSKKKQKVGLGNEGIF